MPLKRGKGKVVISRNIGEMMHSFEEKGKIGNTRPKSKGHAQKIAVAAAMGKAGLSRKKRR